MPQNLKNFFNASLTDQIVAYAKDKPTEEVCGFVVETDSETIVISAINIHENPSQGFRIDSETYLKASNSGSIKAVYHSHLNDNEDAFLSIKDVSQSKSWKLPYLLYHVDFNVWDYFDPLYFDPYPLIAKGHPKTEDFYRNWAWRWDRCDCYTMVRSWFKGWYDIEIEDYPRPKSSREIFREGWNDFDLYLPSRGFEKVSRTPIEGDIVLMTLYGENPHHAGIILSENRMLHLYDDKTPSNIVMYGSTWKDSTKSVWRHTDLNQR